MRDTTEPPPPPPRLRDRLRAASGAAGTDTRALFRRPRFLPVVLAGVAISALGGPFGTFADLGLAQRLGYWMAVILPAAVMMSWLSFFWWRLTGWPAVRVALAAWACGVMPLWALVATLEWLLPFPQPTPPATLWVFVALPLLAVTLLANWFNLPEAVGAPDEPAPTPAAEPAILARIPPRLGRDLVSLQAQGHYLEVVTLRGKVLILMPISQAEAGLAGWPGMRVNLAHVRRVAARGGRMELELAGGQRVPVARALARQVRAALDRHGPPDLAG